MESKVEEVLVRLNSDILGCDLTLSLFLISGYSYRHSSILIPFPTSLYPSSSSYGEDEQNIEAFRQVAQRIPSLKSLKDKLERNPSEIQDDVVDLVHWILCQHPSGLRIECVPSQDHESILALATDSNDSERKTPLQPLKPAFIFKVTTNKSRNWNDKNSDVKKLYGFHGSQLDNFYSILSHGLQQQRTTRSLFGEGIYLSTELSLTLVYAKSGRSWDHSVLGRNLSCIVLSEILDHPDVKLHTEDPQRNQVANSEGGKVPERYLIVRNDECLLTKYLIVFNDQQTTKAPSGHAHVNGHPSSNNSNININGDSWFKNNKMILLLVAYAVLLLAVGLAQSTTFKRFLHKHGFTN